MRKEAKEDLEIFKQHLDPKHFNMLWHDEISDIFLLTKNMEVYIYSKTVLGFYCWHDRTYSQLSKKGLISHEMFSDDPIIAFRISIENLPLILSLGAFKRRPYRKGRWIQNKEQLLGHRIFPYTHFRPKHKEARKGE